MRRRPAWVALLLLSALVADGVAAASGGAPAAGAGNGGTAYEGDDRVRLRLPASLAPAVEEFANAGYRLGLGPGPGEATVEAILTPLASRAPFRLPERPAAGEADKEDPAAVGEDSEEVSDAARRAVAGAETVHQAVSAVLGWIVRHVGADDATFFVHAPAAGAEAAATPLQRPAAAAAGAGETAAPPTPQGAVATPPPTPARVIEQGAGDAEAVARLAVAMLAAVGIEARPVRGRVVGPPRPGAPRGPHAWIEVRYPDRGWLFSDPLHHHHYVPATYLRLTTAGAEADRRAPVDAVELVERRDRRVPVDVYPSGAPGVGARSNGGQQVAAVLRVVVPGAEEGAVVLTAADGGTRRRALLGGEGVFVGLAGGTYTLEVLVPGRAGLSRQVEIAPRQRSAVVVTGEAAAPAPGGSPPAPASRGGTGPGQAQRRPPR